MNPFKLNNLLDSETLMLKILQVSDLPVYSTRFFKASLEAHIRLICVVSNSCKEFLQVILGALLGLIFMDIPLVILAGLLYFFYLILN